MDSFSPAAEVAALLKIAPSTVRHYRGDLKLYSYLANGRACSLAGSSRVAPSLISTRYCTVARFSEPQPELVLEDRPVTVIQWLVSGGSPDPIVHLASGQAPYLNACSDASFPQRSARRRRSNDGASGRHFSLDPQHQPYELVPFTFE